MREGGERRGREKAGLVGGTGKTNGDRVVRGKKQSSTSMVTSL